MYSAPDFVKVELMRKGVFASECVPGTKVNDTDYTGTDLSQCFPKTILGEQYEWQCWYGKDEPD